MTFNPQPKPTPKAKKPGAMRSKPKKGSQEAAMAQFTKQAKSAEKAQAAREAKAAAKPKLKSPIIATGQTKGAMILAMLKTAGGATSKEMEAATDWQPHSVRGYLGTLRKSGIAVISRKLPKEPTIYRIEAATAAPTETEVL